MAFDSYLTPNSFEASEMLEVLTFHDRTKSKPISSMDAFLRSGQYVDSARGAQEASRNYKLAPDVDVQELKRPVPERLATCLAARRSCRAFDANGPFDRARLETALQCLVPQRRAQSVIVEEVFFNWRPYPSPGGLYPVEVHLLEREGDHFVLRHFDPIGAKLRTLRAHVPMNEAANALCIGDKTLAQTTKGAVLFSAVWERTVVKYGFAGYRFALMELGIVSHHLGLALADQGVDTLHWGGFFDDRGTALLGADPRTETLGHVLWYGAASDA